MSRKQLVLALCAMAASAAHTVWVAEAQVSPFVGRTASLTKTEHEVSCMSHCALQGSATNWERAKSRGAIVGAADLVKRPNIFTPLSRAQFSV
jgi:hypothetical protein